MNKYSMKPITAIVGVILVIGILCFLLMNKSEPELKPQTSALVKISSVEKKLFAKKLRVLGTVSIAPENIQQITLQNEALVQQIYVSQGEHVNKEDPLVRFSNTANVQLNLENAKIAADFAQNELIRINNLSCLCS